ncbi:MAG TPA: CAP domain-containing protein [Candidatus Paceibacterota bacterium]|nr:CAP domain-containing protein [Candidatus Paceibacterota bacterium]
MNRLIAYLRRHKGSDDSVYVLGGFIETFILLALALFLAAGIMRYALVSPPFAAVIESALVGLANGDRTSYHAGTLTVNPTLVAAAQAKADDMAQKGYFAHTSPDGKDPWYWFQKAGYSFSYAGENLALDFSDSQDVETAWMNSPEHRANLLNPHFTEIGIATAQGTYAGHETTFVVELFGTPAESKFADIGADTVPANPQTPALAQSSGSPTPSKASGLAQAAATSSVLGESVAGPSAPAAVATLGPAAASPRHMLKDAFLALGGLVLLLLMLVTGFEWKRHHLRHVAAAAALLALFVILFAGASIAFFPAPTIAAPVSGAR